MIERHNHFAIPVFVSYLGARFVAEELPRIFNLVLEERAQDADHLRRSNRGGWHSQDQLLEAPPYAALAERVDAFVGQALAQIAGRVVKAHRTGSWANVNERGDWNATHVHLPDEWAGCLYVKVPPVPEGKRLDGELVLMNPVPLGPQWAREATANYQPQPGAMILFPAFLAHMVAPHTSDEPRCSIAFNYRVTG